MASFPVSKNGAFAGFQLGLWNICKKTDYEVYWAEKDASDEKKDQEVTVHSWHRNSVSQRDLGRMDATRGLLTSDCP